MVLRIHFTTEDLRRLRVAPAPHPTWELTLSINSLQSPQLPAEHWNWRNTVMKAARQNIDQRRWLDAAATLVPANGNFPDFLTPALIDSDVNAHFDAILSTPRKVMRDDLQRTYGDTEAAPRWARALYHDGRTDGVVNALRNYHELALRGSWPEVHQHVEADRAEYARRLLTGGIDELLYGLHPSIRWRDQVLEADYPVDRTIKLAGRGLTVVPAHFCWGEPITFIDITDALQPMLVCPASGDTSPAAMERNTDGERIDRLTALLGHTRARVLAELTVAATTTGLATRLSVTPAAISQHTTVLREAGLLTTARFGRAVRHALTPLGRALLEG
jgi:DNA-binding transcriptional ArsR family regulator